MAEMAVSAAGIGAGESGVDFKEGLVDAQEEQCTLFLDEHDSSANSQPLEVYMYWAAIERKREADDPRLIPDSPWTVVLKRLAGRADTIVYATEDMSQANSPIEQSQNLGVVKGETGGDGVQPPRKDLELEKERAYRLLRVTSWQAVFYLITTDILGFSTAPQTFNELGYGPGVLAYALFYVLAVVAGQIIWKLYCRLDSSKYPVKCYADLGERIFGRKVRHIFNFFQSFQLLFNVAILIIACGQTLVVMIKWKFCYLALNIFFMFVGMFGGQVRSLRNFSWFASIDIWLNIATMIITVVGIWTYAPIPSLSGHADLSQPIVTSGWVPSYTVGWYQQVSGVQFAIFAYAGAMIFPEFMAEMRRPRDFWKSAFCAQLFCFLMYMLFGLICYSRQGQYSSVLPNINFDNDALILVNNVISLATMMVGCILYGNIGVKLFYENVLRAYFKAPLLVSTKGRWLWTLTVCAYWALAWTIGSAVPNITALITIVGSAGFLQFTYTFPPILLLGHWMQIDAMKADNPWIPGMVPGSNRIDTWKDRSRWIRGFKRYWYVKLLLLLIFLAAWANSGIGIYAGIEEAKSAYIGGYNVPFSCIAPSDPSVQPSS